MAIICLELIDADPKSTNPDHCELNIELSNNRPQKHQVFDVIT